MTNFRKRLLIIVGVPLGISLVLAAILSFAGSDITKRTDQIKQLRRDLLFRMQLTESLASLRKDSQQAKNYVFEIENILPNRDQLVSFPRDLSTIARQNKIELNSSLGKESSGGIGKLRQTVLYQIIQTSYHTTIGWSLMRESNFRRQFTKLLLCH